MKDALPSGHRSVNLPRIASGTTTGVQASQNTGVSDTDAITDSVSSGITTISGQQVLAQQLIDQSGIPFDRVIFGDLTASYSAQLDTQVLSGSSAAEQVRGLLTMSGSNAVSYTSTTPSLTSTTAANSFLHQVLRAPNAVFTGVYRAPDSLVMHPRRWAWVLDAIDTANRPLVAADGAQYNGAAVDGTRPPRAPPASSARFRSSWTRPRPNLGAGTNQDVVLVGKFDESFLWESLPAGEAFTAPYANQLSVLFRVFAYSAFIPDRRPRAFSIITGTGLFDPGL